MISSTQKQALIRQLKLLRSTEELATKARANYDRAEFKRCHEQRIYDSMHLIIGVKQDARESTLTQEQEEALDAEFGGPGR